MTDSIDRLVAQKNVAIQQRDEAFKLLERVVKINDRTVAHDNLDKICADFRTFIAKGK